MERREFLTHGLTLAAGVLLAGDGAAAREGLTGRVVLPGQPDYDEARRCYNGRVSLLPAAIVFCRHAWDAANAVRWARRRGLPLRARSGRHSYEGYSCVDDGVVVDVSPMRHIHIDRARRTVRVGAGVTLLELSEALWEHRLALPGGSCPTVGIAGLTLGGGYGLLSRSLGLTCDNLLAVEMVMADGRVLHADVRRHADLLWACRGGGGGNFGVVTAFTFRVHPISQVSIYNIVWDWTALEDVLNAWQGWAPVVDGRLTSILKLRAQATGTVSSVGQFVGPPEELAALLKPLSGLGTPQEVSVESVPYMDAVHIFAGLRPDYRRWRMDWHRDHMPFKNASDYADRPLGSEAARTLQHFLGTAPSSGCLVQFEAYGGAISQVPPTATAFPHRAGVLCNLQYQAYWNRPEEAPANLAWVRQFRQAMRPYVTGAAYANYCDADLKDATEAYYGPNRARLARIKTLYDPQDVFLFPQSIRPD